MTKEQFKSLDAGDIVKPYGSYDSFVVVANYGNRVAAVKAADMTNPVEWDLVVKRKEKTITNGLN